MRTIEFLVEQAQTCSARAAEYAVSGLADEELSALRQAVLLYASADARRDDLDVPGPLTRSRADACLACADRLAASDLNAEAANVYQEATDQYGMLEGDEVDALAARCAKQVLECINAVREQPRERLHLLTVRYERTQQQLALEQGTEVQQADCSIHIARIFQRRDRPAESAARYREALTLLSFAEESDEISMAQAECHHRLANLLSGPIGEPDVAVAHYEAAIDLYRAYEPVTYGFQQSLELCRAALERLGRSPRDPDAGRDREWPRG